jgi:hypothetical protein
LVAKLSIAVTVRTASTESIKAANMARSVSLWAVAAEGVHRLTPSMITHPKDLRVTGLTCVMGTSGRGTVSAGSGCAIEEVDHLLHYNRTARSHIEQGEPYPVAAGIETGQDEVAAVRTLKHWASGSLSFDL